MNVLIIIIVLQLLTTARVGNGYEYELNDWRPLVPKSNRQRPVEIVADVINDLGMKMLDCYMERPGNIAFSPAGLAFVLAALYEGSAGRGNRQIGHILGLPRDRRIIRVGLRDVHRRLRSYLNADSFLGGLTLNRDDITLRPEYEDTLRFYGFDINNMTKDNDTMMMMINTTETTTNAMESEIEMTTNADNPMTMTTLSTTIDPDIVATTEINAAIIATTEMNAAITSITEMNAPIIATTTTKSDASTIEITTTSDTTTTAASTTDDMDLATSTLSTQTPMQIETTTPAATTNPLAELVSIINSTDSALLGNLMDSTLLPTTTTSPITELIETTTINEQNMSVDPSSLNSTLGEITDMNNATDDNQTRLIATTDGSNVSDDMQTIIPTVASVTAENTGDQSDVKSVQSRDDNNVRKRRSIKHRRSFPIYQETPVWIDDSDDWQDYLSSLEDSTAEIVDQEMTQLNFLINGCDIATISTTTYTANLPFAFFPSLHAIALEFPLDDSRYNVIVFMPTEGNDSKTLNRLLATKTLRQLRKSLKSTWVRATIPSFTLRGFITLTPYLQRLGIMDVFEPRTANLSPMSPDLGLYARDVQQSIGVNIRNFMKDMNDTLPTMSTNGDNYPSSGNILHRTRLPIPFIADRPFIFFIVDNETSVALVAGRVDDPLNLRIN